LSEVRRAAEKDIQEANGSFHKFSGDGYVVVYPPNLKTLDERLDYAAEHFKKLRERAGALLNPVQLAAYQQQHERVTSLADLMIIVGIAFGAVGLSHAVAGPASAWFATHVSWSQKVSLHEPFVWVVVLSTLIGLGLSFTRARTLDGAGASKVGTLLLYILIACIGMQMDIKALADRPWLFALGLIWISVHIVLLWLLGKALRVPFFYFAMGSQSNIGGPASAPVVASVFHPSLAPVGALLGALGYATGTVAAYIVGITLRAMAGAS